MWVVGLDEESSLKSEGLWNQDRHDDSSRLEGLLLASRFTEFGGGLSPSVHVLGKLFNSGMDLSGLSLYLLARSTPKPPTELTWPEIEQDILDVSVLVNAFSASTHVSGLRFHFVCGLPIRKDGDLASGVLSAGVLPAGAKIYADPSSRLLKRSEWGKLKEAGFAGLIHCPEEAARKDDIIREVSESQKLADELGLEILFVLFQSKWHEAVYRDLPGDSTRLLTFDTKQNPFKGRLVHYRVHSVISNLFALPLLN